MLGDMKRLFFIAVLFCFLPLAAHADIAHDVAAWQRLRDPAQTSSFASYRAFLLRHQDWPDRQTLFQRAESTLADEHASDADILDWFARYQPVSDRGRFLYLNALFRSGQQNKARDVLQQDWRKGAYNTEQQQTIRQTYRTFLSGDDNAARLQNLLDQRNTERAQAALNYVGAQTAQIGRARLALQRFDSRAIASVQQLPRAAYNDQGFLYDLTRYWRQEQQDELALQTMQKQTGALDAVHAARWWGERAILTRRAMERNDDATAYRIVAAHRFASNPEFAEAEWLAGWLATVALKNPQQGYRHFERMYKSVKTPISVSRAAYWAGVAADKSGQRNAAKQWYGIAAVHMHTFYGQMAAYALGDHKNRFKAFFRRNQGAPSLSGLRTDLAEAARIFAHQGMKKERDMFLQAALNDAIQYGKPQAVTALAKQLSSPRLALLAAKAAYDKGQVFADALFPRVNFRRHPTVEPALALGVMRQESQFDAAARSPADARGLMQVLDGTARHVGRKSGIAYRGGAQLFVPADNIAFGQAYLASLLQRYEGSLPLAIAAYNAGPGNVDKWLPVIGDPRRSPNAWINWVERIPFYETRNYVQRVWENYMIYKMLP